MENTQYTLSLQKTLGVTSIVILTMLVTVPGFAQSSTDSEVKALKQEVKVLRELVEQLLDERSEPSVNTTTDEEPEVEPILESVEIVKTEEKKDTTTHAKIGRYPDDAFIRTGDFDGAIKIPGNPGSFKLGGFVQVNANYDFDNQGFQQIGVPFSIPLDDDSEDGEDQSAIHARLTTFNFDYRTPTDYGDFRTFIEFDMFGDGDEFTNDYDVRLRHAAVELGNWRFGQYHSGFIDTFSLPESADPTSPLATPVLRQPGIYYMRGENEGSNFGVGIENPAFDYAGNSDQLRSESMPNLVAFGRIQRDWGYIRLAALALQMRSKTDEVYTGGAHLSGRINLPFAGGKDNLSFGIQAGEGFVHYYSSFVGGLDGVIADNGDIEAYGILGAHLDYQHWWSDRWRSTFMASFFDLDTPALAAPLSYAGGERFTANLFWSPIDAASFGIELNYNTLVTADGSEGEGLRLEAVGRFFF